MAIQSHWHDEMAFAAHAVQLTTLVKWFIHTICYSCNLSFRLL